MEEGDVDQTLHVLHGRTRKRIHARAARYIAASDIAILFLRRINLFLGRNYHSRSHLYGVLHDKGLILRSGVYIRYGNLRWDCLELGDVVL